MSLALLRGVSRSWLNTVALSSVRLYVWRAVVGRVADSVRSYYGGFLLSAE